MKPIPYGRQQINSADIDAVANVLHSDTLTTGPIVAEFERKLCKATGAKYAVACANGTAALHLACLAAPIEAGDLVVTSPLTFLASANCAEFCGGRVDFIDIDPSTLCLSPTALESYCRERGVPKAVVAVGFAGVVADLPRIYELSRRYGFLVIEDAAHSLGSTYRHDGKEYGSASCQHSDFATLSFHPVKTITTGEGGALLTNSEDFANRARRLRSHGMTKDPAALSRRDGPWYYEMHELGYNYRITDIQTALGISQLKRLSQFKARRQEIYKAYRNKLGEAPGLVVPPWPSGQSPCFHLFPIQFRDGTELRLRAYEHLLTRGIQSQVHYIPVYWQPYYQERYGYPRGYCKESEKYYAGCLSLPLFPDLTDTQIEEVINAVLEITD